MAKPLNAATEPLDSRLVHNFLLHLFGGRMSPPQASSQAPLSTDFSSFGGCLTPGHDECDAQHEHVAERAPDEWEFARDNRDRRRRNAEMYGGTSLPTRRGQHDSVCVSRRESGAQGLLGGLTCEPPGAGDVAGEEGGCVDEAIVGIAP